MCEHCRECGIISVEEYDADDDELCEFMEDEGDLESHETELPECQEKAAYLVAETMVEEHLCSEHSTLEETEEAEADSFTEYIGLGSSRILPIEEKYEGTCEYFDSLDPNPVQCTNQASHARLLEYETLYCEDHLRRYQEEASQPRRST